MSQIYIFFHKLDAKVHFNVLKYHKRQFGTILFSVYDPFELIDATRNSMEGHLSHQPIAYVKPNIDLFVTQYLDYFTYVTHSCTQNMSA